MREIAKRISLRLDSAEYEHLKQLSADTGLKMEPVLRRLIVGAELRPRPPDELPELLRQLSGRRSISIRSPRWPMPADLSAWRTSTALRQCRACFGGR